MAPNHVLRVADTCSREFFATEPRWSVIGPSVHYFSSCEN
jgi:hypothetical protein